MSDLKRLLLLAGVLKEPLRNPNLPGDTAVVYKYANDGVSTIGGDPSDGVFVTVTPQDQVMEAHETSRWRLVPIDNLPRDTKVDIASWIAEHHPYFADSQDWTLVRDNLFGLAEPPKVGVGKMDVASLYATMNRSPSPTTVAKYTDMLRDKDFDFDPVLVAGGRFLDGGHRLAAYKAAGRTLVPVVEIGHLVNASEETWERWMDGDPDASFDRE